MPDWLLFFAKAKFGLFMLASENKFPLALLRTFLIRVLSLAILMESSLEPGSTQLGHRSAFSAADSGRTERRFGGELLAFSGFSNFQLSLLGSQELRSSVVSVLLSLIPGTPSIAGLLY